MTYVVVYERIFDNWGAFVPDLPGYGATAASLDELRALVREGLPFHIAGLRCEGLPIPEPAAVAEAIEIA